MKLREQLGSETRDLSRGDLAKLLTKRLKRSPAIADTTVMKWESGTTNGPDPWVLIELAKLAGVPVEQFVHPSLEEIVLRSEHADADPFADGAEIPTPPRVEFTGEEEPTRVRRRKKG